MEKDSLPAEFMDDVVGAAPAVLRAGLTAFLRRRREKGQAALAKALERQALTLEQVAENDRAFRPIYRYLKAVDNAAADFNIRLLAEVVAFHVARPKMFDEPELDELMTILAEVTPDEIVVVGTLYRLRDGEWAKKGGDPLARAVEELVPDTYPTRDHVMAIAARAQRAGLVRTWSSFAGGYAASPILEKLVELPEFEAMVADPFVEPHMEAD